MRSTTIRSTIVTATMTLSFLAATTVGADATFPGTGGELAYLRARASGAEHYSLRTMNADGSFGRVLWPPGELLGQHAAFPWDAEWSPDGSVVAMTALGGTLGDDRLVIGDPETGERDVIFRIRSLNDHDFIASIAFSPAGDRLLFCAVNLGSTSNSAYLFTIALDGSDLSLVSDRPACLADWSSTDRIVATSGDLRRIITMDADGTNRQVVVDAPRGSTELSFTSPSWSPDGSRFAYSLREGAEQHFDLFSVAADGSDTIRLTESTGRDELYPVFSPDGTTIAFTRSREYGRRQSDLFSMAAEGSTPLRLTDTPRADEYADSWGGPPP
jgi:Tol biopolymer transport system component